MGFPIAMGRPRVRELLTLPFFFTPVAMFGAIFFVYVLEQILGRAEYPITTPYPEFLTFMIGAIVWGLLTGFSLNSIFRYRLARWVGAFGLAVIAFVVVGGALSTNHGEYYNRLAGGHRLGYQFEQFFAPGCGTRTSGGGACVLGQLLITVPVLSSIAFSIGAGLALRLRQKEPAGEISR